MDIIRESIRQRGMRISEWADEILGEIHLSKKKRNINLALLSVAEFNLERGDNYGVFCQRVEEFGLDLCPDETGPRLRKQYPDQSTGEMIIVASRPIIDSGGGLNLFYVARDDDGLWLSGSHSHPDNFWYSGCQIALMIPPE